MKKVMVYDHPVFRRHDPGMGHPERAARLDAITAGMRESARLAGFIERREPRQAESAELMLAHTEWHVEWILSLAGSSMLIDGDTAISPASVEAARRAAGAAIEAVDAVLGEPGSRAFCIARPPGHHAESDQAMGFCIFNNAAVAAAHAIESHGLERVLIFDPDVHHGNGTQEIFYRRRDVLYISIHQWPMYPGTGDIREIGEGDGRGYTLNLPFPAGCGDSDYMLATREAVIPALLDYRPQLAIFSAGFDAHGLDPLGGMRLSTAGFVEMYGAIQEELDRLNVPFIYCLEGGYSLEALQETVPALMELAAFGAPSPSLAGDSSPIVAKIIAEALRLRHGRA